MSGEDKAYLIAKENVVAQMEAWESEIAKRKK